MAVRTFDPQRLIDILQAKCPHGLWSRSARRLVRYAETYLMMADVKYRPAAPGDGCGGIYLSKEQLADEDRLYQEAVKYAVAFDEEEETHKFDVGCSDFETNRAFILAIEAARLLAGGLGGEKYALRLLRMAIEEIERAAKERHERHSRKERTP